MLGLVLLQKTKLNIPFHPQSFWLKTARPRPGTN
jgi:hypothetical protein